MAAQAPKNLYKLFVGNLPWTVSKNELKLYFSQFGYVQQAKVIFDKETAMSSGYGFVIFATKDGFNSAANNKNHFLDGRVLTVETAKS